MLGKNILNLFVQYEEKPEENSVPAEIKKETQNLEKVPSPSAQGIQDDTVAKLLTETLEQTNIEGFDYFEFTKMLEALKPGIPSEQVLFQTAFTSSRVMKCTKEKLLQTSGIYIEALKNKANEFESAYQSKIDESITQREKEAKDIDETIKEKAKKNTRPYRRD